MKVLHVVVSGHMTGGQAVALKIMDHLVSQGKTPCVLSPSQGTFTEILSKQGIQTFFKPMKKTYHIQEALWIAKLIKKEKIDLVHTHSLGAGNILSRFGAVFSRRPVISHVHIENNFNQNKLIRAYQLFLENLSLNASAKIVAVSKDTKESICKQGIDSKKIEVVPNGVEIPPMIPDARASVLKELSLPPNARLLLCIGRLCETKGQSLLLQALPALLKLFPETFLLFAGEDLHENGNYKKKLLFLAQSLGISKNAIFLGERKDIPRLLQGTDFLVLPSFMEGFPMVILEAMASGKAVIASRAGGTPELLLDGETGFLTRTGDKTHLVEKIVALLQNPGVAERMGNQGRLQVQTKYLASAMIQRIMEIYNEVFIMHAEDRT